MTQEIPFDFTDQRIAVSPDRFVAQLPEKLTSRQELLQALYEGLRFPGYFGFNWDALADCLRDFEWLNERTVVLVHADLPQLLVAEQKTYLEILADAVHSWQPDEEHRFEVAFPVEAQADVVAALA